MQFYDLLTDLYESYTPEKAAETVAYIRQELSFEVLYEQYDGQTLRTLLNDHHEAFYDCLAQELVADLNQEPVAYFRDWQPLLAFFDRRSTQLLYYYGVQQESTTDMQDLLQGLRLLDSGQPKTAVHSFHQWPHYVRHYFIGRCYIAMGMFENAICQYDLFLNALIEYWPLADDTNDDPALHYYLMAQWHVFKDLAHCHTQLGNYEDAQMNYELAFNYFTNGNVYVLSQGRFGTEAQLFHTMMSQYLLALEQTGRHDTALEYASFALKHYPYDAYYSGVQQRCQAALGQQDFADQLLTQVFQSPPSGHPSNSHTTPTLVTALSQWVAAQLNEGASVFQKHLCIYQDEGRYGQQVYVAGADCFVDLLLEEEATGILYAVAFCTPTDATDKADQLERCREALAEELEREVKGILCLYGVDVEWREGAYTSDTIEVHICQFSFNQLS